MSVTMETREMFKAELAFVHERIRAYWAGELDGHCVHGVYVGGCGIDWMCGICESGDDLSPTEWAMENVRERIDREKRATVREIRDSLFDAIIDNGKSWSEKEREALTAALIELGKIVRG